VIIANEQRTDEEKIDVQKIMMPSQGHDLFKACRLIYQAIGSLRIAISDGQHRMAAMVELLSGWKINIDSRNLPPFTFRKLNEGIEGYILLNAEEIIKVNKLLKRMTTGRATVQIIQCQSVDQLEEVSQEYSKKRAKSQALHKKRNLADV
jgi:hypothetical protein